MDIADFPALKNLNQTQMDNLRSTWEARTLSAGEDLMHRGEEGGDEEAVGSGHLHHHDHGGEGHLGRSGKERPHADQDEGGGRVDNNRRDQLLGDDPEGASEDAADGE